MVFLEYLEGTKKIISEKVNMYPNFKNTIFYISCFIFLANCTAKKNTSSQQDSPVSGTISISVDESFEPVIREQLAMYKLSFPNTTINASYKSEAECLNDFFTDSLTRMVIVTRGLTENEEKFMTNKLSFNPGWNAMASDAVAIVIPISSVDSLFTMERLQLLLSGNEKNAPTVVFDGLSKTSTARFVQDSVLKGKPFDTSVVRAVKNSNEVLHYIATHNNAIGFVGINRIGNPEDSGQVAMLKKVKLAYIRCNVCLDKPYVLPSQETIQNHRYPLVRGLYYLIKENYKGLGNGLVSFLKYERGQLIFKRAYLGPTMNFMVRNVILNVSS